MICLKRGTMAHADVRDTGGAKLFVEELFVFLVEGARRFVEECDSRFLQKETCEGDTLLFPEGEDVCPIHHFAKVAADPGEDVVEIHSFEDGGNRVIFRVFFAEWIHELGSQVSRDHVGLLGEEDEVLMRWPVNGAGAGLPEAGDRTEQGALARAALAHDEQAPAWWELKG